MDEHAAEAKQRWGHTDAYEQSAGRTSQYTETDWARQREEAAAIDAALVALMKDGVAPNDHRAMELAEQHRTHISKWFYDCSSEMHAALAAMYLADARFTENIDEAGPGLAAYLSAAIAARSLRDG